MHCMLEQVAQMVSEKGVHALACHCVPFAHVVHVWHDVALFWFCHSPTGQFEHAEEFGVEKVPAPHTTMAEARGRQ